MTLQNMIYFKAVCDSMSMTKAAETLYVSQPTVSAAIQDIECECRVSLFTRKGNQLILTDHGKKLLYEITPIVKRSNRINKLIQEGFDGYKLVRIGYSYLSSCDAILKICAEFYRRYPEANLQMKEGATDEHYRRLENGEADIIFATRKSGASNERWKDMGNVDMHLIRVASPMMLCVSEHHHLARQSFVSLQQLIQEPLILLEPQISHYTKKFLNSFQEAGLQEPKRIQYTFQTAMAASLALAGVSGAILPADIAGEYPGLVTIPFDKALPQPIYMFWRKESMQFRVVEDFVKVAKELY